jgi:hypothetical protein
MGFPQSPVLERLPVESKGGRAQRREGGAAAARRARWSGETKGEGGGGGPRCQWDVCGFRSNSSALVVRVPPGQHGVVPRQLRAPGRGATAPAVETGITKRGRRGRRETRRRGGGPQYSPAGCRPAGDRRPVSSDHYPAVAARQGSWRREPRSRGGAGQEPEPEPGRLSGRGRGRGRTGVPTRWKPGCPDYWRSQRPR